jgi:hypothetical protein
MYDYCDDYCECEQEGYEEVDPREDRDYDLAREDGWSYEDIRDRAYRLTEED